MPVWKQAVPPGEGRRAGFPRQAIRPRHRAVSEKFANAYPPNIDVLVDQRFLRKKFKDPITNDDFVPIPAGQALPGGTQQPGGQRGATAFPDAGRNRPADPARSDDAAGWCRTHRRSADQCRIHRTDVGRHSRRDQQEQGSIHSPLQRTRPLQRVGLRLHSATASRRRRRRRNGDARRTRRTARQPGQAAAAIAARRQSSPAHPGRRQPAGWPRWTRMAGRGNTAASARSAAAASSRPTPRRRAAGSEVRTLTAVPLADARRGFLCSEVARDQEGRDRGDDEQADADCGAAQQDLADAE